MELYHPVIRNGIAADMMVTFQHSNRNSRLQTLWDCNSILCGNAWVKPPATLTTTKVQCEGCRTWFMVICSSSDADNWKCALLVLCIGHLRFCFLLDLAIHCLIGQHTLHNFHLLLTAVRVTDYNIMYGGPNLTRGASKC